MTTAYLNAIRSVGDEEKGEFAVLREALGRFVGRDITYEMLSKKQHPQLAFAIGDEKAPWPNREVLNANSVEKWIVARRGSGHSTSVRNVIFVEIGAAQFLFDFSRGKHGPIQKSMLSELLKTESPIVRQYALEVLHKDAR